MANAQVRLFLLWYPLEYLADLPICSIISGLQDISYSWPVLPSISSLGSLSGVLCTHPTTPVRALLLFLVALCSLFAVLEQSATWGHL